MANMERVHLSITEEDKEWANEHDINLSLILRKAIEERREADKE